MQTQENAAPSMHLTHYFYNDAILKMQKIKILQSAYASYFEVNSFTKGYTGLQQTPDTSYGNSNILISSLWDFDTATGIYSIIDYEASTTVTSRFGGEGDGYRTINPYNWQLNTWYNLVNRAWKANGRLFIATFINNLTTSRWFHTATFSIPDSNDYLNSVNDAFLENWTGTNNYGSFIRKALFKDAWNINIYGVWEKSYSTRVSINNDEADINRNGIYHNSFDACYNYFENAYYLQHGGNTTPSYTSFLDSRTVNLPIQTNQSISPILTLPVINSMNIVNNGTKISWTIDEFKSPQLSSKLEIFNNSGAIVDILQDILPQRREFPLNYNLSNANYVAKLIVKDIFNQDSLAVTSSASSVYLHTT